MNNMTALVSCFARYYHTKTDEAKIFDDPLAGEILSEDEKNAIAENMKNGIAFFDPNYSGGDPLGRVMNGFIAPSVIARSALYTVCSSSAVVSKMVALPPNSRAAVYTGRETALCSMSLITK